MPRNREIRSRIRTELEGLVAELEFGQFYRVAPPADASRESPAARTEQSLLALLNERLGRSATQKNERLNVSAATLQRVIAELQQEGLVEAVRGQGVRRLRAGQRSVVARGNKNRTVALCAAEIGDAYLGGVLTGVASESRERGYRLIVADSQLNGDLELENLKRLVDDAAIVLLIPVGRGSKPGAPPSHTQELGRLIAAHGNVLAIERTLEELEPPLELIASDNILGGFQAGHELRRSLEQALGERARECKVFVLGRTPTTGQLQRNRGFVSELYEHGWRPEPAEYVGDPRIVQAFSQSEGVRQIIEEVKRLKPVRPAAIESADEHPAVGVFCMADAIALALLGVFAQLNIRVPEDVRLIGFDDAFYAEYIRLSTLKQDFEGLGRLAVKQGLSKLTKPQLHHQAALQIPELKRRFSTDPSMSARAMSGQTRPRGRKPSTESVAGETGKKPDRRRR